MHCEGGIIITLIIHAFFSIRSGLCNTGQCTVSIMILNGVLYTSLHNVWMMALSDITVSSSRYTAHLGWERIGWNVHMYLNYFISFLFCLLVLVCLDVALYTICLMRIWTSVWKMKQNICICSFQGPNDLCNHHHYAMRSRHAKAV